MSTFKNIPTPGSEAWKDNVATTVDLPLTNNVVGDKRQVLDTKTIYSWNGSGWTAIASPAAAIAITGLLGDVTATGPGAVNATLKTVNLNVGEFGDAATAVTFTVNAKGLVTGASETPIQIAESQVTNLVDDLAGKLTKGTKTIFCIDNGDFATGQAAIDAASGGDTILFGVKQGGWGNLVIPAGKTLSLVGLNNPRYPGTTIQIGSITFSPTTGLNPNLNELHLANLYILSPAGTSAITFGGSAPARLRVDGCYIYSNTVTGIVINNTDAISTSASFQDCQIQSSANTNTHVSATSRYVTFNRCNFGNGNKVIDVVAGVVELILCRLEVNSASAIVTASSTVAPTFLSIFSCLIANSTTNGSGVALSKGAPDLNFVNLSSLFTIAGTGGFCVSGTGTHAYSYPVFSGANTRFVTTPASVTLPTTPTLV